MACPGLPPTRSPGSLSFIYNVTDPTGGPTLINNTYGVAINAVPVGWRGEERTE